MHRPVFVILQEITHIVEELLITSGERPGRGSIV